MKEKHIAGLFALISVMIWAAAMFGCAAALDKPDCRTEIQYILGWAAASHVVFVWGPMGWRAAKADRSKEKNID